MIKKVTLYSLNPNEYPNEEVEVEVITNTASQIDEFADKEIINAIKYARVDAYPAQLGQDVDTRPRVNYNGNIYTFLETKQVVSQAKVDAGAMIVKNPDGEEYIIASSEIFSKKYTRSGDKYRAVDGVKPFRRVNKNVVIQTSWGEEQIALAGSMLCVADPNDIYSVTNAAFEGTYTTDPVDIEAITTLMSASKKEECVGE